MKIALALWSLLIAASCISFCSAQDNTPNPYGSAYRNRWGKLPAQPTRGDRMFADYLLHETNRLCSKDWALVPSASEWEEKRLAYHKQLLEMLCLDPLPEKTNLQATVTGIVEQADFTVEKMHFQSRPGLYVTGNVYVPKGLMAPAPAILYVCGHGQVKIDGISYGNKVHYQHHGGWFAKNGYVCLVIDTVQLGEIEGVHHGTFHDGMWWWNSRGYSSAGVEAWNCIRAIDYLQSRPDVDDAKIGVTGRSGGGAYSWWAATLDERIAAACPVAGITDLRNHVVDGCVEGHCDCMYTVNTYRWDYAQVAAMVAPRPLLICNTDKDYIFPLDGVVRLHADVRRIYDLYDAPDKLGLLITEGPHSDTQDLQVPVMRWFNKWLKGEQGPVKNVAEKLFSPQDLKVFAKLPSDEITSTSHETFTELATETTSIDHDAILAQLRVKTFGAWPKDDASKLDAPKLNLVSQSNSEQQTLSIYEFQSEPNISLRVYVLKYNNSSPKSTKFKLVDTADWIEFLRTINPSFPDAAKTELALSAVSPDVLERTESVDLPEPKDTLTSDECLVVFAPRGLGASRLSDNPEYQSNVRRRMMLLGSTLASSRVWDVIRCIDAMQTINGMESLPIHVAASRELTEVVSFAALFNPKLESLSLVTPPRDDKHAADFLNWSRILTPGQLLELTGAKTKVLIVPNN